jgi:hypothetical protein
LHGVRKHNKIDRSFYIELWKEKKDAELFATDRKAFKIAFTAHKRAIIETKMRDKRLSELIDDPDS